MPYYYKRPGDWLWKPHETESLAEDVRSGRLGPDWKYRIEGESEVRSLEELLEAERVRQSRRLTPDEMCMLAPDATWGWIVVVGSALMLAVLLFVPLREGSTRAYKFYLAGLALIWMSSGIWRIRANKAWKSRHRPRV